MAERLKAPDSKSGRGVDLLVGSNPTLSANWKTAKEPEKVSAQTSFLAKSRLPSFFNLIDFIKFVSIFMKG